MKLITYVDGDLRVGAVTDTGVVDLSDTFNSMLDLVAGGSQASKLVTELTSSRKPVAELSDVDLQAPIPTPRRDLFCVGWNYLSHFEEGVGQRGQHEVDLPDYPTFFIKTTTSVVGPGADIPYDSEFSAQIDFEAELAVVIGSAGRNIPMNEVHEFIYGYTLANDITARDVQRRHGGQWLKGKGMDGSCPLGPALITADELPDPQALTIECTVNGVTKQKASTAQMIFPIARVIQELSVAMTLLPGDIVLTGTPEGVGYWRTPQEFLQPGDEVVVSIPELGELRNRVVDQSLTKYERFDDVTAGSPVL